MAFFENEYRHIKERALLLRDPGAPAYRTESMVSVPERLVRCIWYDQLLDKSRLKTADGRPAEIYSQGEWNSSAGPDFSDAMIRIEGEDSVRGDVEIHVRAADWRRHGHHRNPEYCGVALHVALWNDGKENFAVNSRGEEIPQIILADCLSEELDALAAGIDMENYPFNCESRTGLCKTAIDDQPERLKQLLEMAGRERLFFKMKRLQRELKQKSFDEVLYRRIMEGLGYRHNKAPFRRLADIVPLRAVREIRGAAPIAERALALQAVYLGASGLFTDVKIQLWDAETRSYCEAIETAWEKYGVFVGPDRLRKKDWTIRGVRPANFPIRRIAGLSRLMAERFAGGIGEPILEFGEKIKAGGDVRAMKAAVDGLCDLLCCEGEGYWAHRMVPGGKHLETAPSLIGKPLASALVLNVAAPMLLCHAEENRDTLLRDRMLDLYSIYPSLEMHRITRIMSHRMWGRESGDKALSFEINQQGLLQIFFDFCDENIQNCRQCSFPKMLDISRSAIE